EHLTPAPNRGARHDQWQGRRLTPRSWGSRPRPRLLGSRLIFRRGAAILEETLNAINAVIWSPALIYLCLALGLYFSIRTRFMQVRGVPEMLRLMANNKSSN